MSFFQGVCEYCKTLQIVPPSGDALTKDFRTFNSVRIQMILYANNFVYE